METPLTVSFPLSFFFSFQLSEAAEGIQARPPLKKLQSSLACTLPTHLGRQSLALFLRYLIASFAVGSYSSKTKSFSVFPMFVQIDYWFSKRCLDCCMVNLWVIAYLGTSGDLWVLKASHWEVLMEGSLQHQNSTTAFQRNYKTCMWDWLRVFDLHHRVTVRKLIGDSSHGGGLAGSECLFASLLMLNLFWSQIFCI